MFLNSPDLGMIVILYYVLEIGKLVPHAVLSYKLEVCSQGGRVLRSVMLTGLLFLFTKRVIYCKSIFL